MCSCDNSGKHTLPIFHFELFEVSDVHAKQKQSMEKMKERMRAFIIVCVIVDCERLSLF